MDWPIALLASAALLAMFVLHFSALVSLLAGSDTVPKWLRFYESPDRGVLRIIAIIWAVVIASISQVAVFAVLARPAENMFITLLFVGELVAAAGWGSWLLWCTKHDVPDGS